MLSDERDEHKRWNRGHVTAPFASALCGFRANGNPNTSDNNDALSIEWGRALFERLGVSPDAEAPELVGNLMEAAIAENLRDIRGDLQIEQSRPAADFEQYEHLRVFQDFKSRYQGSHAALRQVEELSSDLPDSVAAIRLARAIEMARRQAERDDELVSRLSSTMPEESLLRIDVTVAERGSSGPSSPFLHAALSSKWSLRTDRAQDCVSQGSKLVAQRRGRMPHYAVVTMEPRPAMLRLIAYGSGSVDCVYHLALPQLLAAADVVASVERRSRRGSWSPRVTLLRMVEQRRVRDYDELIREVERLPGQIPHSD